MRFLAIIAIMFFLGSCVSRPDFNTTPEIEFLSVSTDYIDLSDPGSDSLIIRLSFSDGDGDIGIPQGYDETNRFLVDTFDGHLLGKAGVVPDTGKGKALMIANLLYTNSITGLTYLMVTPEIPEKGNIKSVSGTISFNVQMNFCFGQYQYDTLRFSLQLYDRAEHSSNTVITPPIIMKCY